MLSAQELDSNLSDALKTCNFDSARVVVFSAFLMTIPRDMANRELVSLTIHAMKKMSFDTARMQTLARALENRVIVTLPLARFRDILRTFSFDDGRLQAAALILSKITSIPPGYSCLAETFSHDDRRVAFLQILQERRLDMSVSPLPIIAPVAAPVAKSSNVKRKPDEPKQQQQQQREPKKQRKPLLPVEAPDKESKAGEGESSCAICLEMRVTMAIFPCGHTNTCHKCLKAHIGPNEANATCPTCRAPVSKVKRVVS